MTGHRQSAMERERENSSTWSDSSSHEFRPFFREMPDRFTRVITRFLRYSSLFCKLSPNRFSPLIFIILTLVPISQPPNVFSRSLPEFSASPLSDNRSIRYFSALDIPRKQPRSISTGIAENERQVRLLFLVNGAVHLAQRWIELLDASNAIYFPRRNGIEMRSSTIFFRYISIIVITWK